MTVSKFSRQPGGRQSFDRDGGRPRPGTSPDLQLSLAPFTAQGKELSRVSPEDRLYRLQLFDLAARTSASEACRNFGVHQQG